MRQHRTGYTVAGHDPDLALVAQLRVDNTLLHKKLAKLAALVDHFYSAYREAQSLLDRRERELADIRQRLDSKPTSMRR